MNGNALKFLAEDKGGEKIKMKKSMFIYDGCKYRAPWLVVKIAPFAIILGQMTLVMGAAVAMFVVAYGLQ